MSAVFEKMPPRNPMLSMLLGVFAITMMVCGYIGIYLQSKYRYAVTKNYFRTDCEVMEK